MADSDVGHPPSGGAAAAVRRAQLARDLVAACYLHGDFVLSSGRRSNYYFDKYLFETKPDLLRRVAHLVADQVPSNTQRLAAPQLGAVLIGGAVSLELDLPLVIVRRQPKEHGTARSFEGELAAGDRVTLIEDVITTGAQAIAAAERLRQAGAEVVRLIAVLDREEGGVQHIRAAGLDYVPIFTHRELLG